MDSTVPLFKIKAKNKGDKRKYSVYSFMFCKGHAFLKKIWAHYRQQYLEKQKLITGDTY